MALYQLQIEVTGSDWDNLYHYFFKTPQERERFKEQYEKDNTGEDGEYIPNVQVIYYSYSNKDFENLKSTMTDSFDEWSDNAPLMDTHYKVDKIQYDVAIITDDSGSVDIQTLATRMSAEDFKEWWYDKKGGSYI